MHISDIPPRPGRKPKIELRRFAGPADHLIGLSHLRVAHLTDLHFGRITPMAVQRAAIEMTNAESPDLVVITGDFVCHSQLYLDELTETLKRLEAPTIAVLGNHDYWSGADEVTWALDRAGVQVLKNQHTTITLRHQQLQVVGLDDAYTGHADRELATKGLRSDLPSLALSHVAEEADALWNLGLPLVLSGHTHGGQVTFAGLHELALGRIIGHRYVHGLYGARRPSAEGPKGAVYVSAGIGASAMPLRIGDRGRRELAVFELGRDIPLFEEHHEEQAALIGRKPKASLVEKRRHAVAKKMLKRETREARAKLLELKKNGKQPIP